MPENALSFALVHNGRTTSDRITKLLGIFDEAFPAPLDTVQAMTGLSEGLKLEGDLIFILLPSTEPAALPAPMFLLPVSDYAGFANSIRGDATGEICRVTIVGEDVLVAKHGDYALLMNLEHRVLMEEILSSDRRAPAPIAACQEWIGGNDVSAMVTAAGIAYLRKAAESRRDVSPAGPAADPFGKPSLADEMLRIGDSLPFAELFPRKTALAGIGLAIDESINARVRWTVNFEQADAESVTESAINEAFVGFEDKPYALAGSGELSKQIRALLPDLFTSLARMNALENGRENFTEQDWADVRKTHDLWVDGLKSVSCLVAPGKEGEPMLSLLFARLTVDESTRYLKALHELFELTKQLDARSKSDIKFDFQVSPIAVAAAKGIEVSCDFDEATGDGNNHIWQTFLTSLLGVDHKLSLYFCADGAHEVYFAMESPEKLAAFIEAHRKQKVGLASSPLAKKTIDLMDGESAWALLANPQGFVELVRTAMKSMQILGFVPEFPLFPTSPPLGVTLFSNDVGWHGELVMPVEASRALAQFIKEVEVAFR